STVPVVVNGDNLGAANDFTPSCVLSLASGSDVTYAFTAPAAGTYTFDAVDQGGSDIAVAVLDGCSGPELACDAGYPYYFSPASASAALTAGQSVVIVVDAEWVDGAPFTLTVHQ